MGGTSGVQLLQATGWGLLSSVSLLLGCTIGLIKLPGPKFRAVLMAFGGGSLINAVTIELFGEVLHKQAEFGIGITMTCLGAAAFGGGVFATINKALNDRAGFVRRLGSVGGARRLLQRVQQRRLIKRLIQVRQLQPLSQRELARLSTRLYKETYYRGQPILCKNSPEANLYFISSGAVRLHLYQHGDDLMAPSESYVAGREHAFGNMRMLIGKDRQLSAVALSTTRVLCLPFADFEKHLTVDAMDEDSLFHHLISALPVHRRYFQKFLRKCCNCPKLEVRPRATTHPEELVPLDSISPKAFDGVVLMHPGPDHPDPSPTLPPTAAAVAAQVTGAAAAATTAGFATTPVEGSKPSAPTQLGSEAVSPLPTRPSPIVQRSASACNFRSNAAGTPSHYRSASGAATPAESVDSEMSIAPFIMPRPATHAAIIGAKGGMLSAEEIKRLGWKLPAEDTPNNKDPGRGSGVNLLAVAAMKAARFRSNSFSKSFGGILIRRPSHSACDSVATSGVATPTLRETPQMTHQIALEMSRQFGTAKAAPPARAPAAKSGPRLKDAAEVASAIAVGLNQDSAVMQTLAEELREEVHESAHGKTAAIVIWLGMCFDGIPEALVLGLLSNGGSAQLPSLISFCAAVAVANFPEAMSSSATLKACGMRRTKIFGMWLLMFVGTGCGALVGSLLFPEDLEETNREYGVAVIAGVCGGATLAMVANTLLPEAFEQGGDVVGLSCLAGFMTAMLIKSIGIQLSGEEHAAGCIGANSTATIVGDDLTH